MACKIENIRFKGQDLESDLGTKLIEIYGNEDEAKDVYDRLTSSEFINDFGDWINDEIENRTLDSGEPMLVEKISKDGSKHYHFIMRNGEPFYLEVPEFQGFSDVDLTNEINQITSQLAYIIYRDNFKEDFSTIDGASLNIKQSIAKYINSKKQEAIDIAGEEAASEYIEYLDNILKQSDSFESEIKKFFSERKIEISDEIVEDITQENLEEGLQGGDLVQSFEKNSKDNATANVKLMLSFLPKIDNRSGELITGRYLDEPLFNSFDTIYKDLQKELSDITTMYLAGDVNDVFDVMVAKISDLAVNKKQYNVLLDLLGNIDENKKTEFVQAFYLAKVNFYTTTFNKGAIKTTFSVQNVSNANSPVTKQLKEYYSNFKAKHIENNKLSKNGLVKFESELQRLLEHARKNNRTGKFTTEDQFYDSFNKEVERYSLVLQDLGIITMSDESIDLFLKDLKVDLPADTYRLMYSTYINALTQTRNIINDMLGGKINAVEKNPFSHFSKFLFNKVAESEIYFKEDISDNTIFSNGKTYWTFSNPSYISNRVSTMKADPKILEGLLMTSYGSSSLFAKHLLSLDETAEGDLRFDEKQRARESGNRLKALEVSVFNSFQEKNRSIEGRDNNSISKVDQTVDRFNKVMLGATGVSPIYPTITPADKSTLHEIKIDHFLDNTISEINNGRITFSKYVLKVFTDYFESEVNRMKDAYTELQEGNDLKVYYHTDINGNAYDENGVLLGNAFKLDHILSELDMRNMEDNTRQALGVFNVDGSPKNVDVRQLAPSQKDIVRATITKALMARVDENIKRLEGMNILQRSTGTDRVTYTTQGIDSKILEEYSNNITKLTEASVKNMVADFTINSIIGSIEYSKLFTGDPAYYKNMVDFFKRVPATYTNGKNLRLLPGEATFNITVLSNIEKESDFIDEITTSINAAPNLTTKEKGYIAKAYSKVNQTDAQGWITFDRWFFLKSRLGEWSPTVQSIYDKVKKGQPLSPDELKAAAQPLKGVYFGLVNNVPTYLKYSQAVLVPNFTKGTQLDPLREQMEKQGISEAIVLDGVKVGANIPNDITDENDNISITENLSTLTLSNSDWKLQQQLPVKGIKPTLVGSQIKKNIFSSLDSENGMDMYQQINDTLSTMTIKGIDDLSIELGKDIDGRLDNDRVYSMLEREVISRGSASNMLKSVQKNLPIEAIPGMKDKLYNIFFAKVRRAAVKIKSNGGSFIQISNFGIDKTTGDDIGVTWLVDPSELKPPVIEYDVEGKGTIVPGQVLISHSQLLQYVPDYQNMSREELTNLIDPRLLRAISYRIPNQGQSSNDPLQIVGVLPAEMGDSIVAYSEITTKTGSDFDIDKAYVMLPNVDVKVSNANYGKAVDYVRVDIEMDVEEMYNELEYSGYDMTKIDENNLYDSVERAFIKEHVLSSRSNLNYHDDFVQRYGIGKVISLDYLEMEGDLGDNNNKQLQNRLFELYWMVLTDADNYGDLITPIDFPHIKDKIKELHGDSSKQTGQAFRFHDPLYQLDLKFAYNLGKRGVGITANMLVDHNIGKFAQMSIVQPDNKSKVFDNEYSETLGGTKYKIRDTISAFLNAFVDIAKDPYINDGNFNSLTSPIAFYLIRTGVHPDWVVSFIGNPVLQELSEFTSSYESKSLDTSRAGKSAFDVIYEKYTKQLGRDLENLPSYSVEELDNQIKNGQTIEEKVGMLELFDMYKNLGKKLNESVQLSRFDTGGAGKDVIDLMIFDNRIREMYASQGITGNIEGHFRKYYNNGSKTSLGVQADNTLVYLNTILDENPTLFLMASTPIRNLINDISVNTLDSRGGSKGLLKDSDYGKLITNELYKYIMSDFAPFKVEGNPLNYIQNTMESIADYKQSEKDLDPTERNFFIDQLEIYTNSFGIDNRNKSIEVQDRLYRSARDLMEEDPELADDIFISSFLMNGFQTRFIDIKEYIPYQWFLDKGIRSFIRSKHGELKNSEAGLEAFREQFIRNNYENNVVAPVIPAGAVKKFDKYPKKLTFTISDESFALGNSNVEGILAYPSFVKTGDNLYKLIGYVNEAPIYTMSTKLGFTDRQSYLNLREYKYGNTVDSSFDFNKGGKDMEDSFNIADEIMDMSEFNSADNIYYYNPGLTEMLEKTLENILFSEKDLLSLQDIDFTKDDC